MLLIMINCDRTALLRMRCCCSPLLCQRQSTVVKLIAEWQKVIVDR